MRAGEIRFSHTHRSLRCNTSNFGMSGRPSHRATGDERVVDALVVTVAWHSSNYSVVITVEGWRTRIPAAARWEDEPRARPLYPDETCGATDMRRGRLRYQRFDNWPCPHQPGKWVCGF